ncbi:MULTISPECIES: transposase [Falsihalocynthiibacter]|uniref:transposase n=1 Tax=Falsihalocynthiibacter TaxID=2854182 RepID=UPI0030023313
MRDRRTGDLFDRRSELGEKRRRLLDRSWAEVFRNHLLEELPVDELFPHFDERMGRPSKDFHIVIGVLLLQQLHDLSDAATVEALAFNMAWHHALDVRFEADCYFCEKTLRNYRRLFIAQGLDEVLFRSMTDRLVRAFAVDTSRQRMDSTALRSAMRSLTRLGIVVETISKFARELKLFDPALHALIDDDIIRRYVDRTGAGCFSNTAPSTSRRRLDEAGRDLLQLVTQFRNTAAAQMPGYLLLDQVLNEQFEISQGEDEDTLSTIAMPRKPAEMSCDGVSNPSDPDASYNAHKGLGYMAQIVETYAEDDSPTHKAEPRSPDLITHVAVHKMTVHDGHRLPDALDDLADRSLTPKVLLADSHYGSADNMTLADDRSIDLTAPARTAKGGSSGCLTLEDFSLDEAGLVLECPNGVAPVSTSASTTKRQARLDLSTCRECPDRARCLVQAEKHDGQFARFQYTPTRAKNRKRRLYESSDTFREIYRWRAGIEATMSRLKYQMNLAHLRVRGMPAMRYTVNLRALGLNIRRCTAVQA